MLPPKLPGIQDAPGALPIFIIHGARANEYLSFGTGSVFLDLPLARFERGLLYQFLYQQGEKTGDVVIHCKRGIAPWQI